MAANHCFIDFRHSNILILAPSTGISTMSRQYLSAGSIVEEVLKGKSLKSYCASRKNLGKVDYALALQTLKYKDTLVSILSMCNINAEKLDVREGVLLVMMYELLFGDGKVQGGGCVKRAIIEHLPAMKRALTELMKGKTEYSELLPQSVLEFAKIGAFIRINTVKMSVAEGLEHIQQLCPGAVVDAHVPSLVALPSGMTSLGQDPWVKDGRLVIQDKASCFPSQVLFDSWSTLPIAVGASNKGDLIDACAAQNQSPRRSRSVIIS